MLITTRMLTRALNKFTPILHVALCLLVDEITKQVMRPRNCFFYFVQRKYSVFRSSTHNAATLPRSTHIRKTYHAFTIGRIKADFNFQFKNGTSEVKKQRVEIKPGIWQCLRLVWLLSSSVLQFFFSAGISTCFFKMRVWKSTHKHKWSSFHHHC